MPQQKQKQSVKEKKSKLVRFDPEIYPVKLWVICENNITEIMDNLSMMNDSFDVDVDDMSFVQDLNTFHNSYAETFNVRDRSNNQKGVLIILENKDVKGSTIAHEASHATRSIMQYVGISCEWHEPYEYLLTWIYNKIEEVIKCK